MTTPASSPVTQTYLTGTTPDGLAYAVRGQGPPLLLLSGYAAPARTLEQAAAVFADWFTCITFDHRGTGGSRQPLMPVTTGTMARDAARVLRHLNIPRAHVYGLSLGGLVAQELAIQHPETVNGLVLGATTSGGRRAVPAGPWTLWSAMSEARASVPGGLALGGRAALLHAWAAATHDTSRRLHLIAAPTLVLHGDRDLLVPISNARVLAEGIPQSQLRLLRGQGHLYLYEDDEASSREVIAWLRDLPGPPAILFSSRRCRLGTVVERAGRHLSSLLLPARYAVRAACPTAKGDPAGS